MPKAKQTATTRAIDVMAEAVAWKATGSALRERLTQERDQALARAAEIDAFLVELGAEPTKPRAAVKKAKPAPARVYQDRGGRTAKGSIGPYGKGRWRYQLRVDGKYFSKGFATRPEAEAALAKLNREHGRQGGAAPAKAKAPAADTEDEPAPAAPPRDPLADLMPGAKRAPMSSSNPGYLHPGPGWGPIDDAGLTEHLMCEGTGNIPDLKKKRGRTWCQPCGGEGYRRAIPRPA